MKSSRRKILFPLLMIALLPVTVLGWQWLRTGEELDRLDVSIAELHNTLRQIDRIRPKLEAVEKEIGKANKNIDYFRKRLPSEPGTDIFAADIIDRFKEQNIDLDFKYSEQQEHDFYTETRLYFLFNGSGPKEQLLKNIFKGQDRLVQWEVMARDNILLARIFSSLPDMGVRGIPPCGRTAEAPLSYWPFNALPENKRAQVEELCARRKNDEPVLMKIKALQEQRRLEAMLAAIILQLETEKINTEEAHR
jgi:hypothetical protein